MAPYLEQTIEATLGNLAPGDEYLVIDGGSTDGSVDIIRRCASRLTSWVSEPDRGYADAIAKGFARATGDILCWINAGDLFLDGALNAARDQLERTGADMIFGDDFYIDECSRVIQLSRGYVRDLRGAMLYGGWTPLQDACFWRRSLYERVGGIDRSLTHAADYDLFLRLALHGRNTYVPLAFSTFRHHPGQKSIAGSGRYETELVEARRRQLAKIPEARLARLAQSARFWIAMHWRARTSHRLWRRADLVGRDVRTLRCVDYWSKGGDQVA